MFSARLGAGNNQAKGHYTEGAELIHFVLNATMVSSMSGVLSHFGLDVGGLARLSPVSLVSGKISHYFHNGHSVGQMK